jgi:hypothetical protein
MTDNVLYLADVSQTELTVEQVIDRTRDAGLADLMVIGIKPDGRTYFETTTGDGPTCIWHMERIKHLIMQIMSEAE